jgi:predicted transcriptional regulator
MIKQNKTKKKQVGFSLDGSIVLILDSLAKKTGKTKSRIAEEAILRYSTEIMTERKKETKINKTEEIIAKEASEYPDSTAYDKIINNIKNSISEKCMAEKIAGKHNIVLPRDFMDRIIDLSFLPDIDNIISISPYIGIVQQELVLSYNDKSRLHILDKLTFKEVLQLFVLLASMKGMIKILDKNSNEYYLKHVV